MTTKSQIRAMFFHTKLKLYLDKLKFPKLKGFTYYNPFTQDRHYTYLQIDIYTLIELNNQFLYLTEGDTSK